jgi:valyl-tRNA synthetase
MPFITEELWSEAAGNEDMLMLHDWPTYGSELVDKAADAEMNWVIALIETVRSARGEVNVPAALKVPLVQLDLDEAGKTAWANNEALIMKLARIEALSEASEAPKGSVAIPVQGGSFALPLAGIIDVEAEKTRLENGLGKLAKELGGLRGRLKNPKFAESAPADVVEETKANLAEREAEEEKVKAALARLAEIG